MGRHFRQILGSIATKMGIVLLAMAGLTAFVILTSITVFQHVGENLTGLVNDRLPEVRVSTTLLSEANTLEAAVLSMNLATTQDALAEEFATASNALDKLEGLTAVSTSDAIGLVSGRLSLIRTSLAEMNDARLEEIHDEELLAERLAALTAIAQSVTQLVEQEVDIAKSSMRVGSSRTLKEIDQTLSELVNNDVRLLSLIYQARAEVNLLAGVALALTQTADKALAEEFKTTLVERLPLLIETKEEIASFESDFFPLEILEGAIELFEKSSTMNSFMAVYLRSEIIEDQSLIEESLAIIIEILSEEVGLRAESAALQNEKAIKGLLQGPVATTSTMQQLESTVERFVASTLRVTEAPTLKSISERQKELSKLRGQLRLLSSRIGKMDIPHAEELKSGLETLIAFGHPKTGLVQEAKLAVKARAVAKEATLKVREISNALLVTAYSAGETVLGDISTDAEILKDEATSAASEMVAVAAFAIGLLIVAILLTFHWILLPIRKITATTRRLSKGDLSEVTGFERSRGEIGSMAKALSVFRDSLVDNKQRVADEAERMKREHLEAEKRHDEEQKAKQREDDLKRKAEEDKRDQERILANEREEARRVSEEQARKTAEEQEVIVSNLAQGLKNLASGDLTVQIDVAFTEAYEPLRLDFNHTVRRLRDVVAQIANSESSINLSSTEIASRTEQLTRRTQRAAETLAETASSLGRMTDQVRATSDRAGAALNLVKDARDCSDTGRTVVVDTVSAMTDIEEFSKRVSQITEVIDEIAFQTNLLALNAGVEAARAGEAGRGFAVVATEVRELAQRSSSAAGEINQLINDSTKKVEEGARLVAETRNALERIDAAVGNLAIEAGEIAEASQDQAKRIGEINGAVSELDQLTQQNATMSQETQISNQNMLSESRSLAETVAGFSISDSETDTSGSRAA